MTVDVSMILIDICTLHKYFTNMVDFSVRILYKKVKVNDMFMLHDHNKYNQAHILSPASVHNRLLLLPEQAAN